MILKDYQRRAMAAVADFLEQLAHFSAKDAEARSHDPEFGFDWVRRAWEKAVPGHRYTDRKDGAGRPIPAFCLKIPTGGGKTLLAIHVIDQVNMKLRRRQTGLVLWIVPSTQIYRQTPGSTQGPRPPLSAPPGPGFGRTDADSGEAQRVRAAGRRREPVRTAADVALGQS